MLPPETYKKARIEALIHVQVELDPIHESVEPLCSSFALTGKVVRVFRGYQVCKIGQIIKFDVAVSNEVISSFEPCRPSGTLWLRYPDLLCNRYMEVYLNGKPPNCSVALSQYKLITAPTEEPVIYSGRKWWQFFYRT